MMLDFICIIWRSMIWWSMILSARSTNHFLSFFVPFLFTTQLFSFTCRTTLLSFQVSQRVRVRRLPSRSCFIRLITDHSSLILLLIAHCLLLTRHEGTKALRNTKVLILISLYIEIQSSWGTKDLWVVLKEPWRQEMHSGAQRVMFRVLTSRSNKHSTHHWSFISY